MVDSVGRAVWVAALTMTLSGCFGGFDLYGPDSCTGWVPDTGEPQVLPDARVGQNYSVALGDPDCVTIELVDGALPEGLGLTKNVIAGVPLERGQFTVTLATRHGDRSHPVGITLPRA